MSLFLLTAREVHWKGARSFLAACRRTERRGTVTDFGYTVRLKKKKNYLSCIIELQKGDRYSSLGQIHEIAGRLLLKARFVMEMDAFRCQVKRF